MADETRWILTERFDLVLALEFARILLEHFRYADDGIERRAQFVRHVGEKAGFRATCFLRGVARHLKLVHQAGEFCFPLLEFGNVRIGRDDAAVSGPTLTDAEPTVRPIGAGRGERRDYDALLTVPPANAAGRFARPGSSRSHFRVFAAIVSNDVPATAVSRPYENISL